jgi:hypothetical protein
MAEIIVEVSLSGKRVLLKKGSELIAMDISGNRVHIWATARASIPTQEESSCTQALQPEANGSNFHNVPALGRHYGIPPHQRHPTRAETAGAQEYPKHVDLH